MANNRNSIALRSGLLLLALLAALGLLFTPWSDASAGSDEAEVVHIFFSAGCVDCWPYVEDVMLPALQTGGVEAPFEIHDYTVPEERKRLREMADGIELPRSIADSLYAFVPSDGGDLVILGHVPPDLIQAVLEYPDRPARLVVWQPEMHGEPTEYRLWAWTGDVMTFDITTPFEEALPAAMASSGPLPVGLANLGELLPAVIVTGLLDSVNPCAFAVILLLLAFLFTIRKSRRHILKLGFVYIGMIFIVYFAIGLGILQAVRFSNDPHFVARAGSWILISLGVINLIEYFFPEFPIKLHMPMIAGQKTNELLKQATLPATIGAGLLVGLCTFPCSGGVYVSIITLLNARTTLAWGVSYLALYNVLFVLPLVVILLAAGNRLVAKRWARWERENARRIRLWYGLAMVALGAGMLVWVIA
ncbi:MAG: cytochrome c biogenesis protein CcdA [Anaerolineales bacterium]|nr:cytochrome c biogenesis protein CcdA [Anaerolineales bacterium]